MRYSLLGNTVYEKNNHNFCNICFIQLTNVDIFMFGMSNLAFVYFYR